MGVPKLRLTAILAPGLLAGLAALSLLSPLPAGATVTSAGSSPSRALVAATGSGSVEVVWRAVRQELNLPNPGTVSSPRLRFLIDGVVVSTVSKPLSRPLPGTAGNETATFREVIQIPGSLIYRAVKQGSPLTVQRGFTDGGPPETAELLVTPSGPGSAALAVQRLEIGFDDDSRVRVLPKGSELRAIAELSTSGVGRIDAQWEVADASTTAGAPVFRPLALVRQGVAGGGRTVITSPPLPTGIEGTALVRLRVLEPGLGFATPALQYYVTPGEDGVTPVALREVILAAPPPGESLTAATRFAWSALAGAEAYQLALYATPAGPAEPADPGVLPDRSAQLGAAAPGEPLAAVFVPGARTEASLEGFTLAQLPAERSYLWQVLAIDANGALVGSSAIREIYKP